MSDGTERTKTTMPDPSFAWWLGKTIGGSKPAPPPGSARIVGGSYDQSKARTVNATLASAAREPVAHVGGFAKKLTSALADAQADLGG
jgi:hypothetical protein